jgi:hypothetical protein
MPFWTRCALLLVITALTAAPIAAAAEIHPSVFPSVLRGQGPWDVTYLVELDSGPSAEQVVLSVSNGWGPSPEAVLTGPGKLTRGASVVGVADRFCAGGNGAFSSYFGQTEWLVDMPPYSVNTVAFPLRVNHRFGVAATRLDDLSFSTAVPPPGYDVTGQRETARLEYSPVALPGPQLLAARDAGISLTAAGKGFATIKPGQRIWIRGKASRLIAGQRIDLRAAYDPAAPYALSKMKTRIASVRVRDDGTFGTSWRPPKAGRWTVAAFYDSHDPRFLDSEVAGCYPIVQVGAAGRTT